MATVRAIVTGGARFESPEESHNLDISHSLEAIVALAVFLNNAIQVVERIRTAMPRAPVEERKALVRREVAVPSAVEPQVADAVIEDLIEAVPAREAAKADGSQGPAPPQ